MPRDGYASKVVAYQSYFTRYLNNYLADGKPQKGLKKPFGYGIIYIDKGKG